MNSSDYAVDNFVEFMKQYKSLSFYLLNFLPNMISQAFVYNIWLQKIDEYQAEGNKTGLVYVYCVIIRHLFFFEVEDPDEIDDPYDLVLASTRSGGNNYLQYLESIG